MYISFRGPWPAGGFGHQNHRPRRSCSVLSNQSSAPAAVQGPPSWPAKFIGEHSGTILVASAGTVIYIGAKLVLDMNTVKTTGEMLVKNGDRMEARLDGRMNRMEASQAQTRSELNANVVQTRSELNAKIDQTRSELNAKIDQTRSELNANIDQTRSELNGRMDRMEAKLDKLLEASGRRK
ncbi:hypothetical protein GPECTOR_24g261 [Gonium pectorale]|uniref:Uncharacterized protein n=1 Tax=Gonium pectorale TaxID=33097 RepID=A0A150GGK2_GONPE|nr:hypothetical protein GPECTOR_24g261 [Gonium pectorale]|eukprot:KXZ48971.1 hypothetical protein GPECTOR_24g261 [Gonium pectorale]